MNLAIHDVSRFCGMVSAGHTADWNARGIEAWITTGCLRAHRNLPAVSEGGALRVRGMEEKHEDGFELFKQRLKPGFCEREATMFFLAIETGSVVFAGEAMVVSQALELDLRVWSGDPAQLDRLFPPPGISPAAPNLPSAPEAPRPTLSSQFPSARQVPARDEPMPGRRERPRGLIAKQRPAAA